MALATINPWQVLDQIQKEAFANTSSAKRWHPATDITEHETGYRVTLDLPGINPDAITIEVKDQKLQIKGGRELEQNESERVHYRERVFGEFNRSFRLPKDADETNINAKFEHGVLQVEIPKAEKAQPRKIAIDIK